MNNTMTLQTVQQSLILRLERNKGDILISPNPQDSLREHVDRKMPVYASDTFDIVKQEKWINPEENDFGSPTVYDLIQDMLFNNLLETAHNWLAQNKLN